MSIKSIKIQKIIKTKSKSDDLIPMELNHTYCSTIFGNCLAAFTKTNQLAFLRFTNDKLEALEKLKVKYPKAKLIEIENMERVTQLFDLDSNLDLEILLNGTDFEVRVWQLLLDIPRGATVSYQQLAVQLGNEKASRAVARACSRNRIAYVVPCHRVIRKNGDLGGFNSGLDLKQTILDYERK